MNAQIKQRNYSALDAYALSAQGTSPLLGRILAARNLKSLDEISSNLGQLHHYSKLAGVTEAAQLLKVAIDEQQPIVVIADYDCDGATACAVAVKGLRNFGAVVNYVVPDRMVHGYGLTPSVVELALSRFPQTKVLITVDNGVASHAGVTLAKEKGLYVLVTDHHLPAKTKPLPDADVIVDPSLPYCEFPSKCLAGVGVIWYVLWALQDVLRHAGTTIDENRKVSTLLPLVAIGTVADVVPLDTNNRILVKAGLERIHKGLSFPGIHALATVGFGNRTLIEELSTVDIAFGLGPRINAAGRLETMDLGIDCLLSENPEQAKLLAKTLNDINQERKAIEQSTVNLALEQASEQVLEGDFTITAHADHWHPGVIGIVAGRLKERYWRPTFVLATDPTTGEAKGSGRSILGFNLKDALDQVDKMCPGLMLKFGGHAMAAGLTLAPGGVERFAKAFEAQVRKQMDVSLLQQTLEHDGPLNTPEICEQTIRDLRKVPWGQQFPEPSFVGTFNVLKATFTGKSKNTLKMLLEQDGVEFEAVKFKHHGDVPEGCLTIIYKLSLKYDKFYNPSTLLLIDNIT